MPMIYRSNDVESWYQDYNGFTHDPFYVHTCRNVLVDRMHRKMYGTRDYFNQKDILLSFTKRILKRYY